MTPQTWAAFAVASATGAVLRFLVDTTLARRATGAFPRGTLVVNLLGSLVLGAVVAGATGPPAAATRFIAGTGFCGAFTTFSTFCYETVLLLQEGQTRTALTNVAVTAMGCLGAASLGYFALV